MKPIVSSLVALALAIAPMTAMAKPHAAKAKTHHKVEKAEKGDEKAPIVRVKAGKKDGSAKSALHHAHNVDLGGAGHKEPKEGALASKEKSEKGEGALVKASLRTASAAHTKKAEKDLPKLPNPGKPSKGGAEKGARKAAEKKNEVSSGSDDTSGEPARDEDTAELVARIRGNGSSLEKAKHAVPSASKTACLKEPVEIIRGPEVERFELTTCDGKTAPFAVEHLSVLIRPGGAARPTAPIAELAKKPGSEIAPGIRRVDTRLVERIQAVVDHFDKPGASPKLSVISGYRPASIGSKHSTGKAIDFRIEGVKNEEIVLFCKTLGDTGCGFYPNSSFVHIDVRDPGAGHVSWIDASGPGETPRYVTSWPPQKGLDRASTLAAEGAAILKAERPAAEEEDSDEHAQEDPAR